MSPLYPHRLRLTAEGTSPNPRSVHENWRVVDLNDHQFPGSWDFVPLVYEQPVSRERPGRGRDPEYVCHTTHLPTPASQSAPVVTKTVTLRSSPAVPPTRRGVVDTQSVRGPSCKGKCVGRRPVLTWIQTAPLDLRRRVGAHRRTWGRRCRHPAGSTRLPGRVERAQTRVSDALRDSTHTRTPRTGGSLRDH